MKSQWNLLKSINGKTLLIVVLALVFTVAVTVGFTTIQLSQYAETVAKQSAQRGMEGLANKLESLKEEALQIAKLLSDNPDIVRAVENRDSARLSRLLDNYANGKSVDLLTVADENGVVLLRTHEPQTKGDNISSQYHIRMALNRQPVSVVEPGADIELSVRAGVPVINNLGKTVGILSAGYSLEKPDLLDQIKQAFHTDVTLFAGNIRFNTTIIKDGNRVVGTELDPTIASKVLNSKESYVGTAEILNIPYVTSYKPLIGADNTPVGVIFAGQPLVEAYQLRNKIIMVVLLLTVVLVGGVIFIISYFLRKIIIRPVEAMVDCSRRLAEGDTDIHISATSNDEVGILMAAFATMAANIREMAGAVEQIAAGDLTVEASVKSDRDILGLSINKMKETLIGLTSEFNHLTDSMIRGRLDSRGDSHQFGGVYQELMVGLNEALGSIVNNLEIIGTPIMFVDTEFNIQYINTFAARMLGRTKNQLLGVKCYDAWQTSRCRTSDCPCAKAMRENSVVEVENDAVVGGKALDILCMGAPLKDKEGQINGAFEFIMDQTVVKQSIRKAQKVADYQAGEVSKLVSNLEMLANGHLNIEQTVAEGDEDTKEANQIFTKIAGALNETVMTLKDYITEISDTLTMMAQGNLRVAINRDYRGDFEEIKNSLNLIIASFNEALGNLSTAAEQVAGGAKQVAESSQSLSQGSAEQASTVEEITASVSEIAAQTKQNAANATQANELALSVKMKALDGNEQMQSMLQAMREINESSSNISRIIKVIDEIAFQTNILALNAAVEAARAGQYGKGFAVVAEEVRNLAARSANAAKETTAMIEGSIKKVEAGTEIANATALALQQIVEGVGKTSELVGEIAEASNEQATAVAQINMGISQVSQVIQSNSTTAEESAAASEELSGQAMLLKSTVERFEIDMSHRHIERSAGPVLPFQNTGKNSGKKPKNQKIILDDSDFSKY